MTAKCIIAGKACCDLIARCSFDSDCGLQTSCSANCLLCQLWYQCWQPLCLWPADQLAAKLASAPSCQTESLACVLLQHLPIGEAFLARLHGDPDFNATFRPWLAGLPVRGEIFGPEAWSDAEIRMLQGGDLVRPFDSTHCQGPSCITLYNLVTAISMSVTSVSSPARHGRPCGEQDLPRRC